MLGRYGNGMTIEIPASFRDNNKDPVDMENVSVGIQYFDKGTRKLNNILQDTNMRLISKGSYLYAFKVPPQAKPGNYVVHIRAKSPGSISNVVEATDTFEVIDGSDIVSNTIVEEYQQSQPESENENPNSSFDVSTFKIDKIKSNATTKLEVSDTCVDPFDLPVKGVHVNVFMKAGYSPKAHTNVKVASTVTDENGMWNMMLLPGDYVFTYRSIGNRENREFRKV